MIVLVLGDENQDGNCMRKDVVFYRIWKNALFLCVEKLSSM